MNKPLTIKELVTIAAAWPDDTPILIGSSFPDCSGSLAPLVSAVKDDGKLCLCPEAHEIPFGLLKENAGPLDLALAAMRYQLVTPYLEYDPDTANHLFQRAFTAIKNIKELQRGLI